MLSVSRIPFTSHPAEILTLFGCSMAQGSTADSKKQISSRNYINAYNQETGSVVCGRIGSDAEGYRVDWALINVQDACQGINGVWWEFETMEDMALKGRGSLGSWQRGYGREVGVLR